MSTSTVRTSKDLGPFFACDTPRELDSDWDLYLHFLDTHSTRSSLAFPQSTLHSSKTRTLHTPDPTLSSLSSLTQSWTSFLEWDLEVRFCATPSNLYA